MMMFFAGEGWGEGMEKSVLRQRARDLRKNSTDAERHLWYYLRANRLGFKFKRQVPIGEYIVDFVCLEKRLIIELDGGQKTITMLISPNIMGNLTFMYLSRGYQYIDELTK